MPTRQHFPLPASAPQGWVHWSPPPTIPSRCSGADSSQPPSPAPASRCWDCFSFSASKFLVAPQASLQATHHCLGAHQTFLLLLDFHSFAAIVWSHLFLQRCQSYGTLRRRTPWWSRGRPPCLPWSTCLFQHQPHHSCGLFVSSVTFCFTPAVTLAIESTVPQNVFTILSPLDDICLQRLCFDFVTGIPDCLFAEETAGKEAEQAQKAAAQLISSTSRSWWAHTLKLRNNFVQRLFGSWASFQCWTPRIAV